MKKAAIVSFSIFLAIVVFTSPIWGTFMWAIFRPSPFNKIVKETSSPDKKWTVTVCEVDYGAMTSLLTEVSIRRSWLFYLRTDSSRVFQAEHVDEIQVEWLDKNAIKIKIPPLEKNEIYKKEKSWNGIQIQYEESLKRLD